MCDARVFRILALQLSSAPILFVISRITQVCNPGAIICHGLPWSLIPRRPSVQVVRLKRLPCRPTSKQLAAPTGNRAWYCGGPYIQVTDSVVSVALVNDGVWVCSTDSSSNLPLDSTSVAQPSTGRIHVKWQPFSPGLTHIGSGQTSAYAMSRCCPCPSHPPSSEHGQGGVTRGVQL